MDAAAACRHCGVSFHRLRLQLQCHVRLAVSLFVVVTAHVACLCVVHTVLPFGRVPILLLA